MSSSFGKKLKITLFGESHSPAVGVVIDGLPAGEVIDIDKVEAFMARRAPGNAPYATRRKEADLPRILSGLVMSGDGRQGTTCGTPLAAVIDNSDTRSADYDALKDTPRPGHADYTGFVKFGGFGDHRGGGHFSGRLTAPLCFAGAVCLQILARRGVTVGGHIAAIAGGQDTAFDPVHVNADMLQKMAAKEFPVIDDEVGAKMRASIEAARRDNDSVGGVVECACVGLPAGIGNPPFEGLENRLAAALFAIPAVKAVEFGAGFEAAVMTGNAHNDPFYWDKDGAVKTRTNHHGGILGGISTAMPLILRVAFKPTPSISKPQDTVNLAAKEGAKLVVAGRHDPCVVPRAVPAVEAAVAIAILDAML